MLKKVFIAFIRFYQIVISPLKPPTCRFYPTCSHYGLEAVQRFGALKGGWLTIKTNFKMPSLPSRWSRSRTGKMAKKKGALSSIPINHKI